ncbi:MAG: carboxypeptidase regulatory-like domain-containing protein, partial [Pedobacter sp.]|nr:carboxypeptidase regulatory-like domain-containing protein [Chitinophagaceae bacterium]
MRRISSLLIALFLYVFTVAQSGTISGKITDTSFKKTMPLATVTVFKAADTSIVTYRLSNEKGEFKITNLPLDLPLRFMVSFSGYEAYRKDFTLSATKNTLVFDSVTLKSTFKQLDEVMVISERPPVIIKQDTIEFNASAFKTLPNALVEDLLKKLPGVQVDADGNITVNGKAVNRILVDGKTFFGEDPKMASKNLPANIIDKVQVVDDKEQMQRNGDDNMNNVGKVVNITLKKGVKKGWFGKVYAGGGTENVYEAGGIANVFRDTLQVSILGYANNLNRPGFGYSDLTQAGGFQRNSSLTGSSSTNTSNSSSGGSSITINGVNFGGTRGGGVATSKGAGFNLNHAPSAKQSFFAQYFYGNVLVDRLKTTETSQYNADTIIKNNTILNSDIINNSHNIGIGAKLKPDSVTTFVASANYTIGLSDENRNSLINSNNNQIGALSKGNIGQINQSNTYNFKENISYTK